MQKNRKKKNYGHLTCYNLLPTDSNGIISPDILFTVHKAMVNSFIRSDSSNSCTFNGSRKVTPFPGTELIQLYYAAAPKPGTHTWFQEQLSAKDATELSHGVLHEL